MEQDRTLLIRLESCRLKIDERNGREPVSNRARQYPFPATPEESITLARQAIERAAKSGAQIVCFRAGLVLIADAAAGSNR